MRNYRRLALILTIYLGTFIATLDISIVNVALPQIQTDLQTSISGLQWVVDIYALCLSAFILSAGPIGDRYGRKLSWLIGVGVFIAGSVICGIAENLTVLLAGRAVQGVAGALLIPGALSILVHAFPDKRERAHIIGGWTSFSAISLVVGPILGGILVETAGWASIFFINVPIGLFAILIGTWAINESAHPDHAAFDPLGQIASMLALGLLTFGLITAGEAGWKSGHTLFPLLGAAIAFVFFLAVEHRVERPLLPLGLFRNAEFSMMNAIAFMIGFSTFNNVFFLSLFFQRAQGLSPAETGWRMAPEFVAMGAVSILSGYLCSRLGTRQVIVTGGTVIAASLLLMGLFAGGISYLYLAFLLAGLGIGIGLVVPASSAALMASVPAERSGMASATMNTLRQAGMTIGIALLGSIMGSQALRSLTARLEETGIGNAADIAEAAIIRHDLTGGGLPGNSLGQLANRAFAEGIERAMLVAGAIAVIVTLAFVWTHYVKQPIRSSSPGQAAAETDTIST
ncbi:MFS transporter [Phyllobacterium myrsinacearum]|uniref:MFS transporter n=1 Tax=Phyllobacterium myrsinacearum TaxID=28101 RepID=A0A2S9JF89_9HYPH|nr:MFS transporter [Phyllobacterium myrsinacearum]PRD51591.1 MFS transporter [Phyllobacterium myrsinacearum]PWV89550.1 EmrB/QacA subfamily drug resistance transporter [Phyllobacterium myrsinacearum]RZU99859.1 EmrB/QacA subfamily drug resistance transporter [Phyllobacterium myrsinacearum]